MPWNKYCFIKEINCPIMNTNATIIVLVICTPWVHGVHSGNLAEEQLQLFSRPTSYMDRSSPSSNYAGEGASTPNNNSDGEIQRINQWPQGQQRGEQRILKVIFQKLTNLANRLKRVEIHQNSSQVTISQNYLSGLVLSPYNSTPGGPEYTEENNNSDIFDDTAPPYWMYFGSLWFGVTQTIDNEEEDQSSSDESSVEYENSVQDYETYGHNIFNNPAKIWALFKSLLDNEGESYLSGEVLGEDENSTQDRGTDSVNHSNNVAQFWFRFKTLLGRFIRELYERIRGNTVLNIPPLQSDRPEVIIIRNVTSVQEQKINDILTHIVETSEHSYIYYISETNLLPFLVVDYERMFGLDECFIAIQKETYDSGDQWNIYYILGEHSDADTRSTAAEYAIMLHDRLKVFNTSFVYRKLEKSAFNNVLENIRNYLPKKDVISMYLINKKETKKKKFFVFEKKKSVILTKKVPPNATLFEIDTCIVLRVNNPAGALNITQACGLEVDNDVKVKAEKLTYLISEECSNIVQTTESEQIIIALGPYGTSEVNNDRKGPPELHTFRAPDGKHRIVSMPKKFDFLDTTACYLLDSKNYAGVFFWVGSAAPLTAQTTGIGKMEDYINKDIMLPATRVTVLQQGNENIDFQLNFPGWCK